MWHAHEGMGWWMLIGSVWFVFFWGLLVWLVLSVVSRSRKAPDTGDTPLEILKRRYARGEITKEDFDRMRRDVS